MSELSRRMQEADITWAQDSLNRHEGGMSPTESCAALPDQVAEIMRNLPTLADHQPPDMTTTQEYVINSDMRLPTPEELRRKLHQEGEE